MGVSGKRVCLHLAFHHHQPVGNFDHIFEECYVRGYAPLLEAVAQNPPVRVNFSYSGPVLQFLARAHPEYLQKLRGLIAEGRVEILGTGFYEPILAEMEKDDRHGQLEKMRQWLKGNLDVEPSGVWLAEGVWDNFLASSFRQTGFSYTIVNRERFLLGGVQAGQVHGYFVTEHQGDTVFLFPHEQTLEQFIPFGKLDDFFIYLRRMANRGEDICLTFADNAERWGVWPGSYERVQASGFIGELFRRLAENAEWVETRNFSATLAARPPQGKCFIPPGVSKEVGAWSLPDESRSAFYAARKNLGHRFDADLFLPFFRAGSWAGFKARFSEANLMEKKALWLKRINRPDMPHYQEVRDLIWQCQCNTAYWHGTAGGIYLPHLREAIWSRLLQAQMLLQSDQKGWRVSKFDFDADGVDEYLVSGPKIHAVIAPSDGGSCLELSHLPSRTNLLNVMTRYRESDPEMNDPGKIQSPPVVDRYIRRCFRDGFLKRHTATEELAGGMTPDLAQFADRPFEVEEENFGPQKGKLALSRLGNVMTGSGLQPVFLRKTYSWNGKGQLWEVGYYLRYEGNVPFQGVFGSQMNLNLCPDHSLVTIDTGNGRVRSSEEIWYEGQCNGVMVKGGILGSVSVQASRPIMVWSYPIMTLSAGDSAPIHQGNACVYGWQVDWKGGDEVEFGVSVTFGGGAPEKI